MSGRSPYFLRDRKRSIQGQGGSGSTRKVTRANGKRRGDKGKLSATLTSWDALLLPELLGDASAFLELEDVRSLVLTVSGSDNRDVIKRKYLHLNFGYIEKAVLTETHDLLRGTMTLSNDKIHDWMEASGEEWKDVYDNTDFLSPRHARVFGQFFGDIIGAARLGRVEVVRHLIEQRGADPNKEVVHRVPGSGPRCIRPLLLASLRPDLDSLRYLLEREDVDRRFLVRPRINGVFVECVLLRATFEALEIVVERGIDVNAPYGQNRETLLMQLCGETLWMPRGDIDQEWISERMRLLLAHGADPSVGNAYGERPRDVLECAAQSARCERTSQNTSVEERSALPSEQFFDDLFALLDENTPTAAVEG